MPTYKVHYFNGRGRGETIRLILHAADQKFEDCRIEISEWPNRKNDFPFGKLPMLEVDGQKLTQSVTIAHYLATQFGLAGKTPMDAAKCHAMVETIRDLLLTGGEKLMKEQDAQKKADIIKNEIEPNVKQGLTKLEAYCAKECGDKSHLVAGQLTYADLEFFNVSCTISAWLGPDYLKTYPKLYKVSENVQNHPKLKAYLSSRPKTMF